MYLLKVKMENFEKTDYTIEKLTKKYVENVYQIISFRYILVS